MFGREKLVSAGAGAGAVAGTEAGAVIAPKGLSDPNFGREKVPMNQNRNLMKKLQQGGNVVLFGFGFSGSGKTYTLLNGQRPANGQPQDNQVYDPSLLELFIKENKEAIKNVEFVEIYPLGIEVVDEGSGIGAATKPESKTKRIICGTQNKSYTGKDNVVKDNNFDFTGEITFENIMRKLDAIDNVRRQNLRVLATPNNPDSSRSFLQISLNLKKPDGNDSGKLIFFDMPGTENTVRIKVDFLGIETFESIIPQVQKSVSLSGDFAKPATVKSIYKLQFEFYQIVKMTFEERTDKKIALTLQPNHFTKPKTKTDRPTKKTPDNIRKQINEYYDSVEKEREKNFVYHISIFKDALISKTNLGNSLNCTVPEIEQIASITEELILFFNKRPEKTIKEFLLNSAEQDEPQTLYFLTIEIKNKIVTNFFNKLIYNSSLFNYVSEGDKKLLQPEQQKQIEENLKIKDKDTDKDKDKDKDKDTDKDKDKDFRNLEIIFRIINCKNSSKEFDMTKTIKTINFNTITILTPNSFTQFKNDTKKPDSYVTFKDNKDQPMLKYLIKLINIILMNTNEYENFISALVFVIFQYVNFIVKQGSAIVTTLEHLKFFFLSNTDNIPKYNNINRYQKASFECDTEDCKCLLEQPKEFSKETVLATTTGQTIKLQEQINQGEMIKYELLSILQGLANNETDLTKIKTDTQEGSKKYTLDLFKTKAAEQKEGGKHKSRISPSTSNETHSQSPVPKDAGQKPPGKNSLFVMFANIKIFRDDDTTDTLPIDDTKLVNSLKLLCPAELDTLEFAQSISSTTQVTKQVTNTGAIAGLPGSGEGPVGAAAAATTGGGKYKIEKFKMKNLMRTLHRHKTHKSSTLKKNKLARTHSNNPIKTKYQHYKLDNTIFKRKSKKNT